MSNRNDEAEARTIHEYAINVLGMEACIVALGVARDLRSGAIPPEQYDQGAFCGTACCIAGHIRRRMGEWPRFEYSLMFRGELFAGSNPSDPILAADAIERFLFEGSKKPWEEKA